MKRRFRFSSLIQASVFVLLLVGVLYSISDACTFMGWVRDPGHSQWTQDAGILGHYVSVTDWMPHTAGPTSCGGDATNAGWGLTWFGAAESPTVMGSFRRSHWSASVDSILYDGSCNPSTTYFIPARNAAQTDSTLMVIGHARQISADSVPNWYHVQDPHPFVYQNLFGKPYAFLHNGKVNTTLLEDSLMPGFAALPIFARRSYANFVNPGRLVDSEWLGMSIVKYMMVQYNYYWDSTGHAPANTPPTPTGGVPVRAPEDWGIRRVAQYLNCAHNTPTSSINGIFADGARMWGIAKSDNYFPHRIFYRNCMSAPNWSRDIVSAVKPDASYDTLRGYNPNQSQGKGNLILMSAYGPDQTPDTMSGTLYDPTELRINGIGHSTGNQTEPAIAVDPDSGSFTAVWVSNNVVVGRWYDQMGMAENDEFVVSDTDPYASKASPAIAISKGIGGHVTKMTVVWVEGGHDPVPITNMFGHTLVKQRNYTWDDVDRTWIADDPIAFTVHTYCPGLYEYQGSADKVFHPSVAYTTGSAVHAVTWEEIPCDTSYGEIRVSTLNGSTFLINNQLVSASDMGEEPDIAYVGNSKYAITYGQPTLGEDYVRVVVLRDTAPYVTDPVTLAPSTNGHHPVVAAQDIDVPNGTRFFVAYENPSVHVDHCEIDTGDTVSIIESATGVTVSGDSRIDIAVPGSDGTYFVCYDKDNSPNGRDVFCAHGSGAQLDAAVVINEHLALDQKWPTIAIAPSFNVSGSLYTSHSSTNHYGVRRMIVWQTMGQDTTPSGWTPDWGIAGQFRGINGTATYRWSDYEDFTNNFLLLADVVDYSATITEPTVYILSDVTITPAGSLTFASGVTVYIAPGAQLRVEGSLVANGTHFTPLYPNNPWSGIYVTGSATLAGCTVEGADIGVQEQDAAGLTVESCLIQNNRIGIYVYEPKNGAPTISNCTISHNGAEGINLFSTYKAEIHDCGNISSNGTDGIFVNNSYAILNNNHFSGNADYGVDCYGSSPVLYCNTFSEDGKGEMYLVKNSYPVLWTTNGLNGGSNTFANTNHTLITMTDSYPVVADGTNQFNIYGTGGYYMADMSASVPKHYLMYNDWNKNPPDSTLFWPSNRAFWVWSPAQGYAGCGTPKGSGSNAAQELFTQGFAAEMAGNGAMASTDYMSTISQYPDSSWAQVAAARLFENQRQVDSAFAVLGVYYDSMMTTHSQDSGLVKSARDLGTRTLVEQSQYMQAIDLYQEVLVNPPSSMDSAYATVDITITELRAELDSIRNHLDSALPIVSAQTIRDRLQALRQTIPPVPEAHHENYIKPPETCVLEQNYPNPFNATTTLRYAVPSAGFVRLAVYNILGQKVATLVSEAQQAGYHTVSWNGINAASGVYIYRLEANRQILTQKMLLLK